MMNTGRYVNILLVCLDWLHGVNARLLYDYNNATLERVMPLIDKEFVRRIFPDYPCLFLSARPDSFIHGVILDILYKELSLDTAILHTNLVHSDSVCRGLIIVSTSMNLSVDFIMQNKPFHKNMRIYIILIKYWDQYLFFQEHWSRELLDTEALVITVFPRQIKVYRLHSYSSEFKMVGVQRKTDYFPSFHTLPNPKIEDYKGRQIVVSTYKCHLFNTLRSMVNFSSAGSIPDLNSYVGIEERIFLEIATRMNLTWKLRISTESVDASSMHGNKSWKPIMIDLYKGDADMGFCSLWNDQAKIHSFDMSAYWSATCLKLLFPRPKKILTNWRNLFEPFNWEIWTLLFSCILLQTMCLMWVSAQALNLKIISTRYYLRPVNCLLEVTRILFMAGCMTGCSKMPRLGPLRHLIAWWFVFSMVVATIYSSSYYSHLTSPEFTPKIKGVKELLEQKIPWGSLYPKPHKWIFHPSNSHHTEYAKYYSVERSIEDRISRLRGDNYAFYCMNINNLFFMDVEDISPHILTRLRTFRTCLGQYFVSFGLRLGTSYLEQLDKIILRLLQSGIIDYWLTRTIVLHFGFNPFNRMYEYKPQNKGNNHEALSLPSLEGAFYLYLVGTALSGVVFLLELRQQNKWISSEMEMLRIVENNRKMARRPRQQRSRRVLLVRNR